MARNISFAMTTQQVRDRKKTVTRRMGWKHAKVGDELCAVVKSQGLKAGEKVERICMIRLTDVRQEPLRAMTDDLDYGFEECVKEGFPPPHPKCWPSEFVSFFCGANKCSPDAVITRLEFRYL